MQMNNPKMSDLKNCDTNANTEGLNYKNVSTYYLQQK